MANGSAAIRRRSFSATIAGDRQLGFRHDHDEFLAAVAAGEVDGAD